MTATIAAISTAQAPGGIGIVRISGPQAFSVADRVFHAGGLDSLKGLPGYTARLGKIVDSSGNPLDEGIALVFHGPKSYTGEDVVELSVHGGLYVTHRVLQAVLEAGAGLAAPGEFTKRAFLNGKMDLVEAESVMALISAGSEQAARAACAVQDGALSRRLEEIRISLEEQASHLAAWADFPEEDVPPVKEEELLSAMERGKAQLEALLKSFSQGEVFRRGVETAIVGRPNAGKSTLMNLLSGCERSIVTEIPGTTRDVVEETVVLGGIPLRLADTAGLRDTQDPVEKIGVSVARRRMETAQLIFGVFDSSQELGPEDFSLLEELPGERTIGIINKTDLPRRLSEEEIRRRLPHVVSLSASRGEGMQELAEEVSTILDTKTFDPAAGGLATQRQQEEARRGAEALSQGISALRGGMTLDAVTVCLEDALSALLEMTGERASEQIIDRVFETFCVGK